MSAIHRFARATAAMACLLQPLELPAQSPAAIPVSTAPAEIEPPLAGPGDPNVFTFSTATLGETTVFVWGRMEGTFAQPTGHTLRLATLDGSGAVLHERTLVEQYFQCPATVSAFGSGFLVTYGGGGKIWNVPIPDGGDETPPPFLPHYKGQFLSASGQPVGEPFSLNEQLAASFDLFSGITATSGSRSHAVVWISIDTISFAKRLMCTLVGPVENPAPQTVEVAELSADSFFPMHSARIAANGDDFLVVWDHGDARYLARRINGDGATPQPAVGLQEIPKVQSVLRFLEPWADGYALLWEDFDEGLSVSSLKMEKLTVEGEESGIIVEPFPQAQSAGILGGNSGRILVAGVSPANVTHGLQWVARWIESDGTLGPIAGPVAPPDVEGVSLFRLSHVGGDPAAWVGFAPALQFLDQNGLPAGPVRAVQSLFDEYSQQAPAVAWDGSRYLCVWQDSRNALLTSEDIRLRVVGQNGKTTGDAVPVTNSAARQFSPAIAASNGRALAAWPETDFSVVLGQRLCARIIDNGVPVGPIIDVSVQGTHEKRGVSVAARPDGFFVSWRRDATVDPQNLGRTNLMGTWVSRDGVVSHPEGFFITSDPNRNDGAIASAGNASQFLLIWFGEISQGKNIYGAFLPAMPVLPQPFPETFIICDVPGDQTAPRLLPTGSGFRAFWKDARSSDNSIYTASISNAGAVLPANGFQLAKAPPHIRETSFVPRPGSRFWGFWLADTPASDPPFKFARAGLRLSATGFPESPFALPELTVDNDVLDCAADGHGGVLMAMESYAVSATPRVVYAMVYPDDAAPSLRITPQQGPENSLILRWQATRLFPTDPGLLESSADLKIWTPVSNGVVNQSTAAEGILLVSPPVAPAHYYRLRANLNLP